MRQNIELKMRYSDLREAHRIAQGIGASLRFVQCQRDTYYNSRNGRFKLRQVWRLDSQPTKESPREATPRPADRGELIWYRRDDEVRPRPSDYAVIRISSNEELPTMLRDALGVTAVVSKQRTVYIHDNVRIHLDDVAELGTFLEFEAIVDETCDETSARAKIERLRAVFEITEEAILGLSYADLMTGK